MLLIFLMPSYSLFKRQLYVINGLAFDERIIGKSFYFLDAF